MLRSLTAKQFVEWEAYARLEPFNELRDDYRAASIRETVFNMAVSKATDRKPVSHFLLKYKDEDDDVTEPGVSTTAAPKQPWQAKKNIALMIAAAYAQPGKDL